MRPSLRPHSKSGSLITSIFFCTVIIHNDIYRKCLLFESTQIHIALWRRLQEQSRMKQCLFALSAAEGEEEATGHECTSTPLSSTLHCPLSTAILFICLKISQSGLSPGRRRRRTRQSHHVDWGKKEEARGRENVRKHRSQIMRWVRQGRNIIPGGQPATSVQSHSRNFGRTGGRARFPPKENPRLCLERV